jgi:hypothetical protein
MNEKNRPLSYALQARRKTSNPIGAYSRLIGTFIMNWSKLEHELNGAISEAINDRAHQVGHLVIENLSTYKKIDLFHKLYLELEKIKSRGNAIKLLYLRYKLTELNSFRNSIVHANWQTLNKKGFVRTRTGQTEDEGFIEFRNVLIKPTTIRIQIRNAIRLTKALIGYTERALRA